MALLEARKSGAVATVIKPLNPTGLNWRGQQWKSDLSICLWSQRSTQETIPDQAS